MFSAHAPSARSAAAFAGAYHQTGVSTGVQMASPHRLVEMLFDGLLDSIAQAQGAIAQGQVELKGRAIKRAVSIVVEGLRGGLNLDAGQALAADLDKLYAYIVTRLTVANLRNDDAALRECADLIRPLRDAWKEIAPQAGA
jgi:flagellar protein FliS